MPDTIFLILWASGGIAIGLLLGWWQSYTIAKFEKKAPEKMIARAYLQSVPRILVVALVLFLAMRTNFWNGIAFAAAFTVSRWIWAWVALKKIKRELP